MFIDITKLSRDEVRALVLACGGVWDSTRSTEAEVSRRLWESVVHEAYQRGFHMGVRSKSKIDEAAKKEDWQQGTLWANQWWQYQVKAADIGLRVKTYLEQHGAKTVAK